MVVKQVATLVELDEATETLENIEYARIKVRVSVGFTASLNHNIEIIDQIYSVVVEEEMSLSVSNHCHYN